MKMESVLEDAKILTHTGIVFFFLNILKSELNEFCKNKIRKINESIKSVLVPSDPLSDKIALIFISFRQLPVILSGLNDSKNACGTAHFFFAYKKGQKYPEKKPGI